MHYLRCHVVIYEETLYAVSMYANKHSLTCHRGRLLSLNKDTYNDKVKKASQKTELYCRDKASHDHDKTGKGTGIRIHKIYTSTPFWHSSSMSRDMVRKSHEWRPL